MYNNDVTYNDKWNTPKSRLALSKLESKYFDKSSCSPDCPLAWSVDVLELFETLDKELGFQQNESTIRGYRINGSPLEWFIKNPVKNLFYAFKTNILNVPNKWESHLGKSTGKRVPASINNRLLDTLKEFVKPIAYGFKACKVRYINPKLNKILKNKIVLGQLKEKFGYLRIYFQAPDAYEDFINNEIRKCELRLALKGCYYPIESFWHSGTSYNVGNEWEPDIVEVTYGEHNGEKYTSVKKTTYRKAMKQMGLDLKEIEINAEIRKAIKSNKNV